ncbi:hypothetical protein [Herbidospora mongoliensis]|uniref:hypothetical protein n=1 Tax=Herbidospora mongoliensis TaxID=688067 RepID=UPI00082BDB9C|nr:hypothetical protein [Herbidospora mongoliensis]
MTSSRVRALADEIDALIVDSINNQPRTLQTRIGPSEMGIPCDLRLGYKLAGTPPVNTSDRVAWKPWLGTQAHEGMAMIMQAANARYPLTERGDHRFLVEYRVDVGTINGTDIDGQCDLYLDGVVWDWKFTAGKKLREYKKNGPGEQYRRQAHVYALGWARKGYPVTDVVIYFFPRDQEFQQRYPWTEPYDEQLALDTIAKVDGIAKLVGALGPGALPLLKTGDAYCSYCPWFKPGSNPTDLARGCAGHPDALNTAPDPIHQLIAQ